jgi:hypothetical protein
MSTAEVPRCRCRRREPTNLRCSRCETPICPYCSVSTVTGFICRSCAAPTNVVMLQLNPGRVILALLACFSVSAVAGWLFGAIIGRFGFFALWGGLLLGGLTGEITLRVSGRKRGPIMEAVAGGGTALGLLAGWALWASSFVPMLPGMQISLFPTSPWVLASFGIAIFSAVSRIRYV